MKNPITTTVKKYLRRKTGYESKLFGFESLGNTKSEAESEMLGLLERISSTSGMPTVCTVGEYTAILWQSHIDGFWDYGIVAGPDRDGIAIGGTTSGQMTYSNCLANVIYHLASIQDNGLGLMVSTSLTNVGESLKYHPDKLAMLQSR